MVAVYMQGTVKQKPTANISMRWLNLLVLDFTDKVVIEPTIKMIGVYRFKPVMATKIC